MNAWAKWLSNHDYILRSGGADGADSAFEAGCHPDRRQIFLPWPEFNRNPSHYTAPTPKAYAIAEVYHPAWFRCNSKARAFHARNSHQVLGPNCDDPVKFIMCWTPYGKVTGGTGQALRLAAALDIPIINLGAQPGANRSIKEILS
jgi:hypothetical protein